MGDCGTSHRQHSGRKERAGPKAGATHRLDSVHNLRRHRRIRFGSRHVAARARASAKAAERMLSSLSSREGSVCVVAKLS
eukprot:6178551-Pleurochrysis_carterae.AAC.2